MTLLSIIIPAYNEARTIHLILDKVRAVNLPAGLGKEVIVVNDHSTDLTNEVVAEYARAHPGFNLRLENHEVNKGKGAALHTGIRIATGDYIIIQDADLEYDPEEYLILLKPMLDGVADAVYGSRFMGGNPHRILFFWHTIGNKFLTFTSNIFSNLNLTDMETCYKLFRSEVIKNIPLQENRFGFEPEVTQKLAAIKGIRIYEVGISYYGRTYEEGKKINWKDGFRALYCILKYGLGQKKFFSGISNTRLPGKKSNVLRNLGYLAAFLIFMGVNLNFSRVDFYKNSYRYVFKSDGLGYYQYLPTWFLLNNLDKQMKYAVKLPNGNMFNKYTWGTAYMQAPFFFLGHYYTLSRGLPSTGYSADFGFFIALGALIYAFLALCLLYNLLKRYVPAFISLITVLLVYFGTNLLFYTVSEPAMSHVYSFFLISLFLYKVPAFVEKPGWVNTLWIGLPLAVAVLIRPTNIIISLYLLLYGVNSFSLLRERFRFLLSKWPYMLMMFVLAIIVFIPQMTYWHLTTGEWFVYSYKHSAGGNETFIYWNNPKIFKVLFGVVSGWFVYSPVMLISFIGMFFLLVKRHSEAIVVFVIFLIILYVNSSWWCYTFDCAFGYRSFIEYYALFAIPMAILLHKLLPKAHVIRKGVFILLAVFFSYLNIRMSILYNWDPCWFGPNWTWKNYEKVVKSSLKGGTLQISVHKLEEDQ
jgi:glycosyltransferase involved in cell wall biosynthesis